MKFLVFSAFMLYSLMGGCQNQSGSTSKSEESTTNLPAKSASVINISPAEFIALQKDGAIVIDVRTPEEVASGYIDGASVFADVYGSDFNEKIGSLDKNKTYLVYCRSGRRSLGAAQTMVDNGFQNVYNLTPGILGWTGTIKQ
ncbi:MAG: rhodanese-like domain-containing protein [Saprospiraceae bacterium]